MNRPTDDTMFPYGKTTTIIGEREMFKSKSIFFGAITSLSLIAAPGAAMAIDCPRNGSINGGTYDEIVITDFVSCEVVGVLVTGHILVRNADHFTLIGSSITGDVRVINTVSAVILSNQVINGDLVTRGVTSAAVVKNMVNGGSVVVSDAQCAQRQVSLVERNEVINGNLRVNCNEKADVKENNVRGGDVTCKNNDRLDSSRNDAVGGRVNCSESFRG
jgi:hypothetical protein